MEHYDRKSNLYQEVSLPRRMFTIDGIKLTYLIFLMSCLVEYSVKPTAVTFYFITNTCSSADQVNGPIMKLKNNLFDSSVWNFSHYM